MTVETTIKNLNCLIGTILFSFKITILSLIIIPYLSSEADFSNTVGILQLITTIGIFLSLTYDLRNICICFISNEKEFKNVVDQFILFLIFLSPVVTAFWLSDYLNKDKLSGDDYEVSLWIVMTYFLTMIVIFFIYIFSFCFISVISCYKSEEEDNNIPTQQTF